MEHFKLKAAKVAVLYNPKYRNLTFWITCQLHKFAIGKYIYIIRN